MENSSTVSSVLKTFCQRSTVHGLSTAIQTQYKPTRIIWFTIVFMGSVGMTFHLYQITSAYLEYKTTEYLYEDTDGYFFPDVTICNQNGISYTNTQEVAKTNILVRSILASFQGETNFSGNILRIRDIFWGLGEEASKLGQNLENFIIQCKFQGKPCKKDDLLLVQNNNFFNCYTFTRRNYPKTTMEGIGAGLYMILYSEPLPGNFRKPYETSGALRNNEGIRLQISAQNTLPVVIAKGHDVHPGHSTSLRFDIVEHRRLPPPYSRCRNTKKWRLKHAKCAYTFTECRNMCIHQQVTSKCGCFPTSYAARINYTARNIISCGHYLFSNKSLATEMKQCEEDVLNEIQAHWDFEKDCDCQLPCHEIKYLLTISQSIWPSDNTMDSFQDFIMTTNTEGKYFKDYYISLTQQNASRKNIFSWIRKSFLKLIIFADTKTVSVKEQIPMCTLIDLLCQIGGCLGLWLGISIVTCAQFFHLIFSLFSSIVSRNMLLHPFKKEVTNCQPYN